MVEPTCGQEINLAESLKRDAGWEIYNFGYSGPNPPYVRIGAKFHFFPFSVEPFFESFKPDRILLRSKVPLKKHLHSYKWIKINPVVFEETCGRKYATGETFPFNQWLRLGSINFHCLIFLHDDLSPLGELPLYMLSIAAGVWLKRDEH